MRVLMLPGAEVHTTGRYLVAAARSAGHQVVEHTSSRTLGDQQAHDLLLYVDPGPPVFPLDIDLTPAPRAAYLIDVHQELESRLRVAALFEHVFVAQRDFVEEFRRRGHRASWLPLACDPAVHRTEGLARDIDVGFVGKLGSPGSRRHAILSQVLARFRTNDYRRFVSPREMGAIYSRSRIVLNASINGDVNMRIFEALAAGALLVTDRIANGLDELFVEGEHYVGYSTAEEAIERIDYYLRHPAECERIAVAGQALALSRHTYCHRWGRIEEALAGARDERPTSATRDPLERALAYARIYESRRDPVGVARLIARSRPSARLGACLMRAIGRVVNARVPLTPGAWRARLATR